MFSNRKCKLHAAKQNGTQGQTIVSPTTCSCATSQKYFTVLKSVSSMVTTWTWLGNTILSLDRRNADPNVHGYQQER